MQPPQWGPPGQPGWGQPTPQWAPPPQKPAGTSAAAKIALAVIGIAAACCLAGALAPKQRTAPAQPAQTVAAQPQGQVAPPPKNPADYNDWRSAHNASNRHAHTFFVRARSLEEARLGVAAWVMLGTGDGSIERADVAGAGYSSAVFVTPRCSQRWIERVMPRRLIYSDVNSTAERELRDGGFSVAECIRPSDGSRASYLLPR